MLVVVDAGYCGLLIQIHHTGPTGTDGVIRFPRWWLIAEPILKVAILIVLAVFLEYVHDDHAANHLSGVQLSTPGL